MPRSPIGQSTLVEVGYALSSTGFGRKTSTKTCKVKHTYIRSNDVIYTLRLAMMITAVKHIAPGPQCVSALISPPAIRYIGNTESKADSTTA